MLKELENAINSIGAFCGVRDIPELSEEYLLQTIGKRQVDVMTLFGGSVLAGADVFADAIKNHIAKTFIIVGGIGHTTDAFYRTVNQAYPSVKTEGLSEAEVFQNYLKEVHGIEADYLETNSTNCGENIANLLALMEERNISCSSIILCHDATMQRRIGATLKRQLEDISKQNEGEVQKKQSGESPDEKLNNKIDIINYASYQMSVIVKDEKPEFADSVSGMWEMDHYLFLLLGEIQRLTDNENGYGPNGRDFIAHVDVPENIKRAFDTLKTHYSDIIR